MPEKVITDIQEIPPLERYPEIMDAIEDGKLVIFIGAGVSRLVGCKSWNDLAYDLLKKCLDLHLLDYHEFDVITNYSDPKKKISIAYGLLKQNNRETFFEIFNDSLKFEQNRNEKNIYDYLALLADTFVTTNSDSCFDQKFIESDIVYDFSSVDEVKNHKLYHIHGVNKDENSLVFTSEQYLNRYNNKDSNGKPIKFLEFLNHLFTNYTVLFIGYGLAEFELLDYLTLKSKSNFSKKRHYALMPYYSFERKIMEHDQIYYDTLNIQIIPYAKDINGYKQLVEIADKWSNKNNYLSIIDTELQSIFSKQKLLKSDCKRIIEIISRDESFLRAFLSLCSSRPEFTPELISYLYKYGFFKPEKNSEYWAILGFLEVYISFCNSSNSFNNISIYTKIIEENINDFENRKSNPRTDNILLELIFHLKEEDIDQKHFDFLKNVFSTSETFQASYTLLHHIFPKIIKFRNKEYIKQVVEVVFSRSFNKSDFPYIFSKVDIYAVNEIIEKYSEKLLDIMGTDFFTILVNVFSEIPDEYWKFFPFSNYKSDKPVVADYLVRTVFNTIIWLLKKLKPCKKKSVLNSIKNINLELYITIEKVLSKPQEVFTYPYEGDAFVNESQDEDNEFSIEEIVNYIEENKEKGLIEKSSANSVVQNWIINSSNNDKEVFDKLRNIDSYFSNSIIYGLYTLAREKKTDRIIHLNDILSYFELKLDSFLEGRQYDIRTEPYNSMCIRNICSFISEYIRNNINKIEKDEYKVFSRIVIKIFNNLNDFSINDGTSFSLNTDYLNSESGACYEALFFLYAYSQEVLKSKKNSISPIFEKEIGNIRSSNFLIMFGQKTPYFFYFDDGWTKKQLLVLMENKNPIAIKSFWSGFYYTPFNISAKLYLFLKNENFLEQLVNMENTDPEFYKKIADMLCIMYLTSVETLEKESLLKELLIKRNLEFLTAFMDSFIFRKKVIKEQYGNLLVEMWKELTSCLSTVSNDPEYEPVIIKLLQFVEMVNSIDNEVFQLMSFSIRTIPYYRIDHFIIPQFLDIYDTDEASRSNIVQLIKDLSNAGTYFSDYDGSFSKLLLKINTNNRNAALEIATIYMKHNEPKYLNLVKNDRII